TENMRKTMLLFTLASVMFGATLWAQEVKPVKTKGKKKEAAVMQTPVPASQSDKIKVSEQTPAQPVAQPQPARQIPAPQEIQAQPPTTPPAQMQTQPAPVPTS